MLAHIPQTRIAKPNPPAPQGSRSPRVTKRMPKESEKRVDLEKSAPESEKKFAISHSSDMSVRLTAPLVPSHPMQCVLLSASKLELTSLVWAGLQILVMKFELVLELAVKHSRREVPLRNLKQCLFSICVYLIVGS